MNPTIVALFFIALCASVNAINLGEGGYVQVDKARQMNIFYWYFPPRNNDPNAPLIQFVQGGPGCAGSTMFMLNEGGPLRVNWDSSSNSFNVTENPFSWTQNYHLVVFDAPVGTGFSYSPLGAFANTNEAAALQIVEALDIFLSDVKPNLLKNDLYIVGESFAGIFIPLMTTRILVQQKLHINLKGIGIGNPWSDPASQVPAYADYLYNTGLIGPFQRDQATVTQHKYTTALKQHNNTLANSILDSLVKDLFVWAGMPDPADIRVYGFAKLNYTASMDYVNSQAVRNKIGVYNNHTYSESCNGDVATHLEADHSMGILSEMSTILNSKVRVLIFEGNFDFTCPTPGVDNFIYNIKWEHSKALYESDRIVWRGKQQRTKRQAMSSTFGYWKHAEQFDMVVVAQAGHVVAEDQPQRAYEMIDRWIRGDRPM